jgi:hypothetical protein
MKNFATFASDIRLNALLCCSAAVLLTACGGSMTSTPARAQSQTAATVASSADQSAANGAASVPNLPMQPRRRRTKPPHQLRTGGYDRDPPRRCRGSADQAMHRQMAHRACWPAIAR